MEYLCRIASRDDLIRRWEYLVRIHPGDHRWAGFRESALKHYDEKSTISYLGFLGDEIICEATAYVDNAAFLGDIHDPSGLLSDTMSYLAAFRTNREYEGQGYFSRLYAFVENDLKQRGYTELSVGVGPDSVRNIQIYFHLGFTDYIKTVIEYEPSADDPSVQVEDVVVFYKKKIG